jgi:hypothetical protein
MTNMLTGGWGGRGGFGQQIANFGNQSGGMGAGSMFGGVPGNSMQRTPQSSGGQYGGGFAANGRSLMPIPGSSQTDPTKAQLNPGYY